MTSPLSHLIDRCCRDIVRRGRQRRRASRSPADEAQPNRPRLPKPRDRRWSPDQDARLRAAWGHRHVNDIATELGRTASSIKNRAQTLKLRTDRHYTEADRGTVRRMYATHSAAEIAAAIPGSTVSGIYQMAWKLGLRKATPPRPQSVIDRIGELHAEKLLDAEIADRLGLDRRTVGDIRKNRLGLPVHADRLHERQLVAVANQLKTLGLTSPTQLRTRAYRNYAIENGWPEDLKPREVQILNVLAVHGPMIGKEIGQRIGIKPKQHLNGHWLWLNGANTPKGTNLSGGSYSALLMSRGLIYGHRSYDRTLPNGKKVPRPTVYMLTPQALELYERKLSHGTKHQAV